MKRTALIALLVDAVEFGRRGLTTDVLLELRRLRRKLSGRCDRAVADVVDVALPVFGKLPVGKLEQALVTAGLGSWIVARLDLGNAFIIRMSTSNSFAACSISARMLLSCGACTASLTSSGNGTGVQSVGELAYIMM